MRLLGGKKTRPISLIADVESINRTFVYPINDTAVSWFPDESTAGTRFPREEVFDGLRSTKITAGKGHDGMSSFLLEYNAVSPIDAFTSLRDTCKQAGIPFPIVRDQSLVGTSPNLATQVCMPHVFVSKLIHPTVLN